LAKYKDWKQLEQAVISSGGLLSVWGEELRSIHGTARIGSDVRFQIIKSLDARDLEIDSPRDFYSDSLVRIYKRGTTAAEIIEAVNNLGQEYDQTIRGWINGSGGKLARIRQILGEDEAAA
jgi:hypothetical protein